MKTSTSIILLMLASTLAPPILAQPGGLSGFPFLRLDPSPRAAALGGSLAAGYDDDERAVLESRARLMRRSLGDGERLMQMLMQTLELERD